MFTSQDYVPMYPWMHAPIVVQGAVQGIVRGDQHTISPVQSPTAPFQFAPHIIQYPNILCWS